MSYAERPVPSVFPGGKRDRPAEASVALCRLDFDFSIPEFEADDCPFGEEAHDTEQVSMLSALHRARQVLPLAAAPKDRTWRALTRAVSDSK